MEISNSPYTAAEKALSKLAKGSDSDLLKKVGRKSDPDERAKKEKNCIMIRNIVDECLEEYREGEYTFKGAIKELQEALEYL